MCDLGKYVNGYFMNLCLDLMNNPNNSYSNVCRTGLVSPFPFTLFVTTRRSEMKVRKIYFYFMITSNLGTLLNIHSYTYKEINKIEVLSTTAF